MRCFEMYAMKFSSLRTKSGRNEGAEIDFLEVILIFIAVLYTNSGHILNWPNEGWNGKLWKSHKAYSSSVSCNT